MISGAEIMVKCLLEEGVEMAFGLPGAVICPFYDELYKTDIKHVLVRSEQNAAHAASGYARTSGKPGVCIATSGPGALNLITGIAGAYMDSIPLICITGQVNSELLGRDVFQEADITGACESITKHSYIVKNTEDLPMVFKQAFHIATTGRPGPVLIDVPIDVQQKTIDEFVYPETADIAGYKPRTEGHELQIKKALEAIKNAERPVICCGGGVVSAGAREQIIKFAKKSGIPVVSTMMGIGAIPMDSDVYLGMIGSHGRAYANRAINNADVIMLCGARVGDRAVSSPQVLESKATIIHIDIDPAEISKNLTADIPIVGDVQLILERLAKDVERVNCDPWRVTVSEWKRSDIPGGTPREDSVEPRSFIRDLSAIMNEEAILCADVGQNQIWAARHFNVKEGRFLTSGGMGVMGYALPAAIGAKLAKMHRQVVAICGDGSFQMQMCELATAVQHGVPVKLIIMDNGRLGMVKEFQDRLYNKHYMATVLDGNPDFVKLVESYGIKSARAKNNKEAIELAKEMLADDKSYVLVCNVDPDTPTL